MWKILIPLVALSLTIGAVLGFLSCGNGSNTDDDTATDDDTLPADDDTMPVDDDTVPADDDVSPGK